MKYIKAPVAISYERTKLYEMVLLKKRHAVQGTIDDSTQQNTRQGSDVHQSYGNFSCTA